MQLIPSDLQTSIGAVAGVDRSTSTQVQIGVVPSVPQLSPVLPGHLIPSFPASSTQSTLRTKGMQLGVNKVTPSVAAAILAEEWTEGAIDSGDNSNPWGNDDLIDINDDHNDWSEFSDDAAELFLIDTCLLRCIRECSPCHLGTKAHESPSAWIFWNWKYERKITSLLRFET